MKTTTNRYEVLLQLKSNKVILCESDTVLALICSALSQEAILKIYSIKQRPQQKPFALFIESPEKAKDLFDFGLLERFILNKYLPGYFTFLINLKMTKEGEKLLPKETLDFLTSKTSDTSRSEDGTIDRVIGIRVPRDAELLSLLKEFGEPIVATSANISGQNSCTLLSEGDISVAEKADCIWEREKKVDYLISSTIVDLTDIKILEKEILQNAYSENFLPTEKEVNIAFEQNIDRIKNFLHLRIKREGSGEL